MDFEALTVRPAIAAIRKHPLDPVAWHQLMLASFDKKDPEAFETYQLITESLERLQRRAEERGEGRALISAELRDALVRVSTNPCHVDPLGQVARLLLEEHGQAGDARRIFLRALKLAPSDAELSRWIERCEHHGSIQTAAGDIAPQDAPSGEVRAVRPRDVRRMIRVTARIGPELAQVRGGQAELPAPVLPEAPQGVPAAEGVPRAFIQAFDALLEAIRRDDAPGLLAALPEMERQTTNPAGRGAALAMAARALHLLGRREEALQAYQLALRALPEAAALQFAQASIYHELARYEEAKGIYRAVLARFPNYEQAWANLGAVHHELEEAAEAEACLRRAAEINPSSALRWNDLAAVLMAKPDYPAALEAVDRALQLDGRDAEAWLKRGIVLLETARLDGAREALATHASIAGENPRCTAYRALLEARDNRPAEAAALCDGADAEPAWTALFSTAWLEAGLAFERAGDTARALKALRRSVELDPGQSPAWLRLGLVCRRSEALEEAETAFARAAACPQPDARAWSELALTRYRLGRHAEAASAFLDAFRNDPLTSDWPYNAGVAFEKAGRDGEAVAAYEQAIRVQPDHAAARGNLGLLLARMGQPEKAASCLQGLLLLKGEDAQTWFTLGIIHEETASWNESARALEKAVGLDPELRDGWMHLAYVYRKLGRDADARTALEKGRPREAAGV